MAFRLSIRPDIWYHSHVARDIKCFGVVALTSIMRQCMIGDVMKKEFRIKVAFNDGNTVSFLAHAESFIKAVEFAFSSYPDSLHSRIVSIHAEDVSI